MPNSELMNLEQLLDSFGKVFSKKQTVNKMIFKNKKGTPSHISLRAESSWNFVSDRVLFWVSFRLFSIVV
jgi:hypothetical protein